MTVSTEQALHDCLDRVAARNLYLELENEELRAELREAAIPPWWHHRSVGLALSGVLVAAAGLLVVLIVRLLTG